MLNQWNGEKMSKTEWQRKFTVTELLLFFTRVKVVRLLGINPTKMRRSSLFQLRNFCLWRTVVAYLIFFNNKATTTTATATIFSFCHIRINLTSSDQKTMGWARATSQRPFVQLLWTHCLENIFFFHNVAWRLFYGCSYFNIVKWTWTTIK